MFKKIIATLVLLLSAVVAMAAVDVNKATEAELDSVKGIGPGTSKIILTERKKGDFKSWDDFITRVKGVGEKRAAHLSDAGLTIGGSAYKPAATAKKDDKAATATTATTAKKDDKAVTPTTPTAAKKDDKAMAKADEKKADVKQDAKEAKADAKADKKEAKAEAKQEKAMAKAEAKEAKADAKKPAASATKK